MANQSPRKGYAGLRRVGTTLLRKWGSALCLAAALMAAPSGPAAAQASRQQVLAAVFADEAAGRAALAAYFAPRLGDPEKIAELTADLIGQLAGDPFETVGFATLIGAVADEAIHAAPVLRGAADPGFAPPKGARGWDFGPPDAPVSGGFQPVASGDERIAGGETSDLRRPGNDGLFADGVLGVTKFSVGVPNGTYRLMVLTDDLSRTTKVAQPIGRGFRVNGTTQLVISPASNGWLPYGILTDGDEAAIEPGAAITGGIVSIDVVVDDERLELEILQLGGEPTYLTGLLLEPSDQPSSLFVSEAAQRVLDELAQAIKRAENRVADAMADLLAGVATAAGVEERVALLDLAAAAPLVEDVLSVSPE